MAKSKTVLFLDFDGVLHPKGGGGAGTHFSKRGLLETSLLQDACAHVEIVISSTWREAYSVAKLRQFFSKELHARIIDSTPTIDDLDSDFLRYREIRTWLNKRPDVKHWFALDDDRTGFPEGQMHRVVVTNPTEALTAANLETLVKLLLG